VTDIVAQFLSYYPLLLIIYFHSLMTDCVNSS